MRKIVAAAGALLLLLSGWAAVAFEPERPVTVRATLPDAIYSWWLHPVAVHDGDRTWVGSIGSGEMGTFEQLNRVWRATAGSVESALLDGTSQPDDHNAAAIAFNDSQQNLIAFYAEHGLDTVTRYQTVDRDTLALGTLQTLDFGGDVTYNQVLTIGDTIHLIVRNSTASEWQYKTSTDWGSTWGSTKTLVDFGGFGSTYVIAKPDPTDPTIVHLGVAPHPPNDLHLDTHYAQIDLTTGEIRSTGGALLGDLDDVGGPALAPTDLEAVISPSGVRTRLLDIGRAGGSPALAYATWPNTDTEAVYRVRRFDGTIWSDLDFELNSGPEFGFTRSRRYLGGMALGRSDDLYTSRQDLATGEWVIEHWVRSGDTLVLDQEVDRSATRLIRPYVPYGAGPTDVVYQRVTDYPFTDNTEQYSGASLLLVSLDEPAEGAEAAAPVALPVGVFRPVVTWQSFDLVTGVLIDDLPDIRGAFGRLLGAHTSADLQVPIPLSGPGARGERVVQATIPGRTLIVAVVNDQPAWGGRVLVRAGGTGGTLRLGCATLESYLARRTVQDHEFDQVDEAEIMATLVRDAGDRDVPGVGTAGGIGLEVDAPAVGVLADETDLYQASDRASVYDRLRERSARQGGLEWTVELLWADDDHTSIRKVVRVRERIGEASSAPNAVFEAEAASDAAYEHEEDYSDGRGATWVEAYSSGEGEDQPTSAPAIATDRIADGWPIDEHHFQPSSSISDESVLDSHAARELELLQNGSLTWQITCRWGAVPRLNVDWRLGDDVGWVLKGHRHPGGVTGQGRVIGWDLDPSAGTVSPILLDPASGG